MVENAVKCEIKKNNKKKTWRNYNEILLAHILQLAGMICGM